MKGIAHFASGIALATLFPSVLAYARDGALLPVVAGVAALLPDILDFKFARYWERYDLEIDPGPSPDPAAVAHSLAGVMRAAFELGEARSVICHSVRLGLDRWRPYTLRFHPQVGEIAVKVGPEVGAGAVLARSAFPASEGEARCAVGIPFVDTYSGSYEVGTFYGPSFRFVRVGDRLEVRFLDWHHRWTHSLVLALAFGLLVGIASMGIWGGDLALWTGLLATLGYAVHVLEDQLGHMGSNLAWPFSRRRMPGLRLLHAADALPNFLVVWTACAVVLINLDRASEWPRFPPVLYLMLVIVLPWTLALAVRAIHAAKARRSMPQVASAAAIALGADEDV